MGLRRPSHLLERSLTGRKTMAQPLRQVSATRRAYLLLLTLAASLGKTRAVGADDPPLRQIINAEVRAAWQKENLTPAGPADDAAFLRRIYLDLCGTIPSADEAAAFLKDTTADKRARLIDRLLDDPRYVEHQAN